MSAAPSRRSLLWPALATIAGVAVLASLGIWQLERLQWKRELLARINARVHAPPGPIMPERDWRRWSANDDEYRHVSVQGSLLHGKAVRVHGNAPRDARGDVANGFFVLTPLRRDDGSVVIVNRGFVPREGADAKRDLAGDQQGPVVVTGLVRAPQERGWFVPEDDPGKDEWFSRNVAAIAAAEGLTRVAPFLIDADATPTQEWPRGGLTVIDFPNNHLEYALTWFGLAAALMGVFIALALSSRRQAA